MLHIAFGGFNKVGDQVIAAFQLYLDLGECVFVTIAQADQAVEYVNNIKNDHSDNDQNYNR